jgi:hypothetical protein
MACIATSFCISAVCMFRSPSMRLTLLKLKPKSPSCSDYQSERSVRRVSGHTQKQPIYVPCINKCPARVTSDFITSRRVPIPSLVSTNTAISYNSPQDGFHFDTPNTSRPRFAVSFLSTTHRPRSRIQPQNPHLDHRSPSQHHFPQPSPSLYPPCAFSLLLFSPPPEV